MKYTDQIQRKLQLTFCANSTPVTIDTDSKNVKRGQLTYSCFGGKWWTANVERMDSPNTKITINIHLYHSLNNMPDLEKKLTADQKIQTPTKNLIIMRMSHGFIRIKKCLGINPTAVHFDATVYSILFYICTTLNLYFVYHRM